jgi:hypothetical protein
VWRKTKGTTTFLPTVEPSSQNHLHSSPPSLTMSPWGWTWKNSSSAMSFSSSRFLLPHTQSVVFMTTRKPVVSLSRAYSAMSCLLTYAIYQKLSFFLGLSPPPWEFSQPSKSLIFWGCQWPNIWFSTCNNQPRGSSNMLPTHGVMVNWF